MKSLPLIASIDLEVQLDIVADEIILQRELIFEGSLALPFQ